jgi:hypothetical protein
MLLQPIKVQREAEEEREPGWDSPLVACEACGKQERRHLMLNVVVSVPAPGHPSAIGFSCPANEHWACSLDCWRAVAHACIDEHMLVLLQAKHADLSTKGA